MPTLENPVTGLAWFPRFRSSIIAAFRQRMAAPSWLWSAPTADLPTTASLGANKGAAAYNETTNALTIFNGTGWDAYAPLGTDTTYLWRANNLSDVANVATSRINLGVTATGADTTYAFRANNLSDLASASAARINLGLGTAAVKDTGTSGAAVPLLNGVNQWAAVQTFDVSPTFTLGITSTTTFSTIIFRGESGGATSASGLRIEDTDASHTVKITIGSDLTANRKLTLTTGNANRTFDISAGDVTISTAGAALIDDADAAAQRATLGLVIGTDVQAYDADLDAVAASGIASAWSTYTPTITTGGGSFTTVSATGRSLTIGKLVFYQITVTMTAVGTATGSVYATTPSTAAASYTAAGREDAVAGFAINALVQAADNKVRFVKTDNTSPIIAGGLLVCSGFYEAA